MVDNWGNLQGFLQDGENSCASVTQVSSELQDGIQGVARHTNDQINRVFIDEAEVLTGQEFKFTITVHVLVATDQDETDETLLTKVILFRVDSLFNAEHLSLNVAPEEGTLSFILE